MLQEVEAKLVGVGKTAQRYPLVIATDYNIPALLDAPGIGLITNFNPGAAGKILLRGLQFIF